MIIDHLFTRTLFESQTDHITQFASNAHEEWRRNFDSTGTKPRIKKNSDGTEGDINVPFADLHPDWQKENLAAAHAAHRAVKHFGRDMEKAAEYVHNEWMKRNPKADYNAAQHVPYDDLPEDEKEKDRVHVRTMMQLMGHSPEQGVAEGSNDTIYPNAEVIKSKNGKPVGEIYQDGNSWGAFHYRADRGYDFIDSREEAIEALKDLHQETGRSRPDYTIKGVAEGLGKQIHGTFQSMGDSFSDAHLAKGISYFLQGRHQEGENWLRGKIPEKAQHAVFSKLKTLQAQSGLDVNKNPNIQKYIDDELVPWVKRQIQQGVAESNTLMKKLHQALLKEGRVKELADDLKTLNNAEFMKKYGKAKAAIRKDMKKVDEGNANSGRRGPNSPPDNTPVKLGRVQKLKTGIKHQADSSRYGGTVPDTDDDHLLSPAARHRLHKAVTPDQQDLDEGNMPQSVIKSKQKYADMSDQEFHTAHKNKSEDDLKSMAWRHGYGKGSNHYVTRHKKGGGQLNELSTNRLAQYKTAAAKDAKQADQAGDVNRGNKRFGGIVKATKKQFDNDAKKVGEGRQARRSLMAQMLNSH